MVEQNKENHVGVFQEALEGGLDTRTATFFRTPESIDQFVQMVICLFLHKSLDHQLKKVIVSSEEIALIDFG